MIGGKKIKNIMAIMAIMALSANSMNSAFAATTIGTASVTTDTSLNQDIVWDDTFGTPGNATSIVTGIKVTAQVLPSMNVSFSTDEIALGLLTPGVASSGDLNIEVGTNASAGVKITARSTKGGLEHTTLGAWEIINNDDADGELYNFTSVTANDTIIVAGIAKTGLALVESNTANIATEHTVYETNKPEITENSDDVVFTVSATSNATTSAWDYEDVITFTVTGNF